MRPHTIIVVHDQLHAYVSLYVFFCVVQLQIASNANVNIDYGMPSHRNLIVASGGGPVVKGHSLKDYIQLPGACNWKSFSMNLSGEIILHCCCSL